MVGRPTTGQRTQIRVDQQDLQRLEQWAQQHGTTKTAAIREAITQFLADENNEETMKAIEISLNVTLREDRNTTKFSEYHDINSYNSENERQEIETHITEMVKKITNKVSHLRLADNES